MALRTSGLAKRIQLPPAALDLVDQTPEEAKDSEQPLERGDELPLEIKTNGEAATDDVDATDDAELDSSNDAEQEGTKSKSRRHKARWPSRAKGSTQDVDQAIQSKFVNLIDVLPLLPKKGSFDVKTIKKSQYFFS